MIRGTAWRGGCEVRAADAIDHAEAAFLRDWLNAVLDGVEAAHPAPAAGATNPSPSGISS